MSGLAPNRCLRSICGSARIVIFAGSGIAAGEVEHGHAEGRADLRGEHLEA